MPCWYWEPEDVLNTPSYRDGVERDTETMYRCEGAKFILQCGQDLGLTHNTIATGIVFFHRFYMVHSFKKHDRYVVAACALFLAGKVEETPKLCRDLIRSVQKHVDERTFATHFASQQGRSPAELVMQMERLMLRTLKFDFIVEHPYKHLLEMGRRLRGSQDEISAIVRHAWAFVNDSLYTTLCLQWEPEIIACSVLYLGSLCSGFQIRDWDGRTGPNDKWWEQFVPGLDFPLIERICHRILDMYQSNNSGGATGTTTVTAAPAAVANSNTGNGNTNNNNIAAEQDARARPSGDQAAPATAKPPPQQLAAATSMPTFAAVPPMAPAFSVAPAVSASATLTAAAAAAHAVVNQVHFQHHQQQQMLSNHHHQQPMPALTMGQHHQLSTNHAPMPLPIGQPLQANHHHHPPLPPPPPMQMPMSMGQQPMPAAGQMPLLQSPAGMQSLMPMQQQQQFPMMPIGSYGGQQRPQQHPNKNLHSLT